MNTEIISGEFTSATIYTTDNQINWIDPYAVSQITMLCNNKTLAGSRIRIMPDVHPGKVGTIGFTATVGSQLMPLLIGIDIGCGMTAARIRKGKKEWQRLDSVIRENIPSGASICKMAHPMSAEFDYEKLNCAKHIQPERCDRSLGTLGSGNHFIEVDSNGEDLYLVIHSGSRHLGKEVPDYYMAEGQKSLKEKEIDLPYELTYLEGKMLSDYMHDVGVVQEYAAQNRQDALQKLNAILMERQEGARAKQKNSAWREHTRIIRGNPVRVYEGIEFKRKK
ncbi:MAG: RtcB family protein [Lachnospiraceae bacterium]|nr:RtcB family protein [Lachnospiraceae bacterium]